MKNTGNTVLVTGGSAGIGFEIARLFSTAGNKVIITGRDKDRLDKALAQLPGVVGIASDVSNKDEVESLVSTIKAQYPDLNIVVNNAGRALVYKLLEVNDLFSIAEDEFTTNVFSVMRLNELLLPLLSKQSAAAIVNVTSVVAIVPGNLPTYSASKAALHSYTQSLRVALEKAQSAIKVFELMPPLVNTEFSAPIGGEKGIAPVEVAQALLDGIANDTHEIKVGATQYIYDMYLKSPEEALQAMNRR